MFILTGCLSASTPEEIVKNHFKDISSELSNDTTKNMLSELVSSKNKNKMVHFLLGQEIESSNSHWFVFQEMELN